MSFSSHQQPTATTGNDGSRNHLQDMSAVDKVELVAAAGGSIFAVDQLINGLQAEKHKEGKEANDHYLKALASAAVAIGAYEMNRQTSHQSHRQHHTHHDRDTTHRGNEDFSLKDDKKWDEEKQSGTHEQGEHKKRVVEEAAGAYVFGRELMSDKKHHIVHLIAEALGAAGLFNEAKTHSN